MFNESNTVEAYLYDLLSGQAQAPSPQPLSRRERGFRPNVDGQSDVVGVRQTGAPYSPLPSGEGLGVRAKGLGWRRVSNADIPRQLQEVLVEPWLREALIRLNSEIAAQPDRADEVLYKLRAIILSVRSDGLIRANEEMMAWIKVERSMPYGHNNQRVPARLIDFDNLDRNQYVVTQQFTFRAGSAERRADLTLLVNGLPLGLIEAKTPTRTAVSWVDGAMQVHDDYERFVPELLVCNVFSVATEGKEYNYGSLGLPAKDWGPWHFDPPLPPGEGPGVRAKNRPLPDNLKSFARELRQTQTDAEQLIWSMLRDRRLHGMKFRR